jgi:DNA-binding transcriptional MerR regulator
MDRHLSPSETAQRFGVSTKALRLYEQRGLLTPLRSESGWRIYGPAQTARLHQILALKRLGLPLTRVREILAGPDRLDTVLALQEQILARQSEQLSAALTLVRAARSKLASGRVLSIDDLATLSQETVMTASPNPEDVKSLFDQTFARHFSDTERSAIAARRSELMTEWEGLKPMLLAAMKAGDPASPAAREVVKRLRDLGGRLTGPDVQMRARFQAFRDEVASDKTIAGMMEVTPEMNDFIKRVRTANVAAK